jgi:hypothetical protein
LREGGAEDLAEPALTPVDDLLRGLGVAGLEAVGVLAEGFGVDEELVALAALLGAGFPPTVACVLWGVCCADAALVPFEVRLCDCLVVSLALP